MRVEPFRDSDAEEDSGILSEINITPLVDVFLVLLIVFMVTGSVMSQLGVDVDLPRASESAASAQQTGVILTLLPDGSLRVNQESVAAGRPDDLAAAIRRAMDAAKTALVILEGDRSVMLGSAIEVMDIAQKAGARKFAVATAVK